MDVQSVLRMNAGTGEFSYAKNSFLQKTVIRKAWPVLEEIIGQMILDDNHRFSECLKIADLGCSSGPNTLLVISNIIDTVTLLSSQKEHDHRQKPEFHVYLNDLPNNDFNNIFKSLPTFYDKLNKEKGEKFGPCVISGVPGSFYGRLFPKESMHLIHSSSCAHYLSRVPEGLENNKGAVYVTKTSPVSVSEVYLKQFQKDLSTFLKLRSEELIPQEHMAVTFLGRSIADPTSQDCCYLWDLLTKSLLDLVTEGMVREEDVDSFNVPCYHPYKDEVMEIVEEEGSFGINRLDTFKVNWDAKDVIMVKMVRAAVEPMLVTHFGNKIIDKVFERYAAYVSEHLSCNYEEKTNFFYFVVSMTKK